MATDTINLRIWVKHLWLPKAIKEICVLYCFHRKGVKHLGSNECSRRACFAKAMWNYFHPVMNGGAYHPCRLKTCFYSLCRHKRKHHVA